MATYDGKKALIVDDFPTARRLIKETLQEIGFECIEAADAVSYTHLTLPTIYSV